jgi:hypothetical protein
VLTFGVIEAGFAAMTHPCQSTSETNIAGHTSVTATCCASNSIGNAVLISSDDKLASKTQSGLS